MSGVTIVPFRRELAGDFRRLNLAWIERLFAVAEPDRKTLDDPEQSIIEKGGMIFFALDDENEAVVGTVAMIRVSDTRCELAKMAVARLANAIRLYERLSFRRAVDPHPSDYARADVYMELPIK
ncbi:MAG: hypothetical protein ACRES3_10170 [Steroidobacteraceae bacterium]